MLQPCSQRFTLDLDDIFVPNRGDRDLRERSRVRGVRHEQAPTDFDQLLRGIVGGF